MPALPWKDRNTRIRLALGVALVTASFLGGMVWFAARVNALRSHHAVGPNWNFPSRIYSDGVSFDAGRPLPPEYLLAELEARDYQRTRMRPVPPGTYAVTPDGFEIGLRGLIDDPDPAGSGGPERVILHLANGSLTGVERRGGYPGAVRPDSAHAPRLEPVLVALLLDEDRIWRTWVSLARVPVPVRDAIVAAEDRRFYKHMGADVRANARALVADVKAGQIRQGGSTITQQLARGLFLGRERTLARKMVEVPLAIGLETMLSKDQILEMYLNSIYWGQAEGFGVGGIAEAARWYFDSPVESLTVLEGATLAAMIPSPNVLDPFHRPERVRERRNQVLEDMVESGTLTRSQASGLESEPLSVRRGPLPVERFPSYSGFVRDQVDERIARHAATGYGLSIFTTLDPAWQSQAEAGLAVGLASLDGGRGRRLEGAFVALEPRSASVLAMVGGRRLKFGDFNRAYMARRQTGSAIKPLVYAAAFSTNRGFTPATTVADTQVTFGKGRWAWRPRNFDGQYHEQVTLAKALEKSLNVATTNLVDAIGPQEVARVAGEFGLGSLKPVLSIGLGSNEVTLLDLTNAFAVFDNAGQRREPTALRAIVDHTGRDIPISRPEPVQVLSEDIAALMTGLLENVVRYGVAYPLKGVYGFDRPVAGKTGTTDDFRDAWFLGFTPEVVAGVWVGYDRPRSIGRQAAHTALPVWARIVGRMVAGFPATPFLADAQLEWADVDPWTGYLADSTCVPEKIPFLMGTSPTAFCSPGMMYGYEYENLDSLYDQDSTWMEEPEPEREPRGEPDTLEEYRPDTSGGEPAPDTLVPSADENSPPGPRRNARLRGEDSLQVQGISRRYVKVKATR